jgi:hypothetical protein
MLNTDIAADQFVDLGMSQDEGLNIQIDLETQLISSLLNYTSFYEMNADDKFKVELGKCYEILSQGDKYAHKKNYDFINNMPEKALINNCFTTTMYRDIYGYLKEQFNKNLFPSPHAIWKYLAQFPENKSRSNHIRQSIFKLYEYDLIQFPSSTPSGLASELLVSYRQRTVKKAIQSNSIDFDLIKGLLNEIESPRNSKDIKSRIAEIEKLSPIQQVLEKKKIRTDIGLLPQEFQELIDVVELESRPLPELVNGTQFLATDFGSSNWIYPALIPANGCTLICGLPGSMKTMFSYACMFSYLNNLPFLGEQPSILAIEKKRGLIINADQPHNEAQAMLRESPNVWSAGDSWDILGGTGKDAKWDLSHLALLENMIKVMSYTFIIVDSYVRIHAHLPKWDENKAEGAIGMNAFQELAGKYNCTFLIIHHANKDEGSSGVSKGRGATYIPGAASAVMNLTGTKPDKNGNQDHSIRFLEIAKLRNATGGKYVIKFNPDTYNFDLMPDPNGQERLSVSRTADTFFNQVFFKNQTASYTTDQLIKQFPGGNVPGDRRGFMYKVLAKLEQRGLITKTCDPADRKRKLYKYKQITAMVDF